MGSSPGAAIATLPAACITPGCACTMHGACWCASAGNNAHRQHAAHEPAACCTHEGTSVCVWRRASSTASNTLEKVLGVVPSALALLLLTCLRLARMMPAMSSCSCALARRPLEKLQWCTANAAAAAAHVQHGSRVSSNKAATMSVPPQQSLQRRWYGLGSRHTSHALERCATRQPLTSCLAAAAVLQTCPGRARPAWRGCLPCALAARQSRPATSLRSGRASMHSVRRRARHAGR